MIGRLANAFIGYRVRREACRLAAQAFRASDAEEGMCPMLWSLTVFFELYLLHGSAGTKADFGPADGSVVQLVKEAGNAVDHS